MCTVLLPPGGYPTAVNKYIVSYIISCHPISYRIIYHIIQYHIISYHISYHTISYHIVSYHTISYHIVPYHIIQYHISYNIISYIVSYHTISYHIVPYHIIQYHIISYHIISYNIIYRIIYHIQYHIISLIFMQFRVLWPAALSAEEDPGTMPTRLSPTRLHGPITQANPQWQSERSWTFRGFPAGFFFRRIFRWSLITESQLFYPLQVPLNPRDSWATLCHATQCCCCCCCCCPPRHLKSGYLFYPFSWQFWKKSDSHLCLQACVKLLIYFVKLR